MIKKHFKKGLCFSLALILSVTFSSVTPLSAQLTSKEPTVHSEGVILMDAKTGQILYEKNAHTVYYPASITKLMTALLVIENLKPTDTIAFSEEAILGIDPQSSQIGIRIGEQLTVDQALHGLLLMSANEVANGLSEAVAGSVEGFSALMTQRAGELGALATNFMNPHGLHDEDHYTTAYDMALIMQALYSNEYFLEIMSHPTYIIPPTNKAVETRPLSQEHGLMNEKRDSSLYRSDVIGGKTGFTNEARHTLVTTARHNDVDLIVVVLKGERNTVYADTNALLDYGFNAYHTLSLHNSSLLLTSLPIYAFSSGDIAVAGEGSISVASDDSLLISKNISLTDITTRLNLPSHLNLGIQALETIGTIDYIYDNEIIATSDLIISGINYHPSPFNTSAPSKYQSIPLLQITLYISLIGLVLFVWITRWRNKRARRLRQLRFNRSLKKGRY